MKKSTILLLVVVYILSFFIIGLLGNSVRSYDPVYEPESIELVEPDGKTFLANENGPYTDPDGKVWDYWFVYQGYVTGSVVRIKANVKPDNSSYPNVSLLKIHKIHLSQWKHTKLTRISKKISLYSH